MASIRVKATTQGDKLKAIANLQSEIASRARSLRAEYSRAAQSHRARLEMRINRIPKALRKANIGELLLKYTQLRGEEETTAVQQKPMALEAPEEATKVQRTAGAPKAANTAKVVDHASGVAFPSGPVSRKEAAPIAKPTRGIKRTSDIMIAADKENDPGPAEALPNPKKRTKPNASPSRQVTNPASVLSPRSTNSRTLPQSPIRAALNSPQRDLASLPLSPLKPPPSPLKLVSPIKAPPSALRTITKFVPEPKAPVVRKSVVQGRAVSSSSNASTGTTITKKMGKTVTVTSTTIARKGVGVSAVGKKVAPGRGKAEAPAAGRVLRKRA